MRHMKEETERLNKLVDWYQFKLNEIREAAVDSRLQKLKKLYRCSEKTKHLGVMITGAGVINPINYPDYPPELELHECEDNNEENPFYDAPTASSLPAGCKPYSQLDNFKKLIKAYDGRYSNAVKYVEKVDAFIKGFEIKNRISINLLAIKDRDIYICRKGGNY